MTPFPALQHLQDLVAVPHGGAAQLVARGLDPDRLLDFSATTYPGPTPGPIRRAMSSGPLASYPDPACTRLRADLARRHGVPEDCVLVANGSVALIHGIARACLAPGKTALVVGPTFGEYRHAAELAGASVVEVAATQVSQILAGIEVHRPTLVFLCNPNNPTGKLWSQEDVEAIAKQSFVLLDEAYAGFLQPELAPMWGRGRIVLRSMTKDRGLAGVRVGYAIAHPETLGPIALCLTPWAVSAVAQWAARAALQLDAVYDDALRALWMERRRLRDALAERGFTLCDGQAPFFLVEVGDATATKEHLLEHGVLVRDCTSFGLPTHIRVSPRTPDQGDRLVAALSGEPMPQATPCGRITLVLGGARSGKSTHAEALAAQRGGEQVSYIATAQIFDEEMADRIAKHRTQRDAAWETLEAPLQVASALREAKHNVVLLDCITLLASNWLLSEGEEAALQAVDALLDTARDTRRDLVVVSNEVGSGVVPNNTLARRFRDLQGLLNRRLMDAADLGVLLVAGQPITVKGTT